MKSVAHRKVPAIAFCFLLASMLACGGTPSLPTMSSTLSLPPTQTSQPTQTPVPLWQQVRMVSVARNETSEKPAFTLKAQIPTLQGSEDQRVTNFNNEMALLTQEEIAKFKDNAAQLQPVPGLSGSSYDQQYKLISLPGNLVSLKFQIMIYIQGAAHPGTHMRTVTYDLEAGDDVTLAELFLPGSDYLERIANYCIAQLSARGIGTESSSKGAKPILENYGNWNVTANGLLITFDEYQVAAYALGPQEVIVPYSDLQTVINPDGSLAGYLP
jgi:hypothetical protein